MYCLWCILQLCIARDLIALCPATTITSFWTQSHVHAPFLLLQGERKDNRARLLLECCAILFASSQMKRLSLSMKHELGDVYLPNKLILLISVASSLVRLTLVIPELRNFKALAETIRSLQKLKVGANTALQCRVCFWDMDGWPALTPQAIPPIVSKFWCCRAHGNLACVVIAQVADLAYLHIDEVRATCTEQDAIHAAESLVTALCCCSLLQALTLDGVYSRCA